MSQPQVVYNVYTPKRLTENDPITKKEWQMIMRLRQARNAGHRMLLVEILPSDLKWSLVGKTEG